MKVGRGSIPSSESHLTLRTSSTQRIHICGRTGKPDSIPKVLEDGRATTPHDEHVAMLRPAAQDAARQPAATRGSRNTFGSGSTWAATEVAKKVPERFVLVSVLSKND